MPLTQVSLAQLLKSETLEQHEAAERLLYPKFDGLATIQDYSDILKTFYGFYAPLEKQVDQYIYPRDLPDIEERKNAYHIIDDLIAIGENVFELPVCDCLPHIQTSDEAFGALYVMEGSALGGRMLRKMLLKKHPGLLKPQHLSFFDGYGEATSAKWKYFQQNLDKAQDRELVVKAANETFTLFQNWIKQYLYNEQDRP